LPCRARRNPCARIDAESALAHPWFQSSLGYSPVPSSDAAAGPSDAALLSAGGLSSLSPPGRHIALAVAAAAAQLAAADGCGCRRDAAAGGEVGAPAGLLLGINSVGSADTQSCEATWEERGGSGAASLADAAGAMNSAVPVNGSSGGAGGGGAGQGFLPPPDAALVGLPAEQLAVASDLLLLPPGQRALLVD
jgi:hypothetical protein